MDGCSHVGSPTRTRTLDRSIPTPSLQFGRTTLDSVDPMDKSADKYALIGRGGRFCQTTQIYEGTNQVQRVVVAKYLLK